MKSSVGTISIIDGRVRFRSDDYGCWETDVNEVVLVGEYTTQDGPMIEDHFLVFLTKGENELECPITAHGVQEILERLGSLMHGAIQPKLTLTTDFESRIIIPASLEGRALYTFESKKQSLLQWLLSGERVKRCLSAEALSVF